VNYSITSVIKCADCGSEAGTIAEIQRKVIDKIIISKPVSA